MSDSLSLRPPFPVRTESSGSSSSQYSSDSSGSGASSTKSRSSFITRLLGLQPLPAIIAPKVKLVNIRVTFRAMFSLKKDSVILQVPTTADLEELLRTVREQYPETDHPTVCRGYDDFREEILEQIESDDETKEWLRRVAKGKVAPLIYAEPKIYL
ncbi:hypothetical protein IAT38_002438 [Cryptococcus sp. DSM 104549]